MNSSLKIILQYQINIQIKKNTQHQTKPKKNPKHTQGFKKDNFTTYTEIAPVNALPSSTEVQQCVYNYIQPWPGF